MEGQVIKIDDFGRGIVMTNNKVTFVPFCVVGDLIKYEIIKEYKNYNEGKLLEVIKKSNDRVDEICPFYKECGGCSYQNVSYEKSVQYKLDNVVNYFNKNDIIINPILIRNSNPLYYRNKISLKIKDGNIGYYKNKSNTLVTINKCLIADFYINKIIDKISMLNIKNGEVIIRVNQNHEILLIINTSDKINVNNNLFNDFKIAGIVLNDKTIYKDNYFYEIINDIKYRISYDSFFQINPYVASKLFKIISDNITNSDLVLDLYCGVGTLSMSSSKAKKVLGIEIVKNAILNANENKNINKINNVEFICDDCINRLDIINNEYNTLIIDPPRKGLDKKITDKILKCNFDKIIYVSCDYHTMLRDVKILLNDYIIRDSYVLDMFSYTYHSESIIILERR